MQAHLTITITPEEKRLLLIDTNLFFKFHKLAPKDLRHYEHLQRLLELVGALDPPPTDEKDDWPF